MPKFQVVSEYQPAGDQPEAIAALADESAGSPVFLSLQTELNSVWTRFCFAKRLNAAGRRRASARGWPPFRFPDL